MSIETPDLNPKIEKPEDKEEPRCRVMWKSKLTGATGNGEYLDKATAESWLKEGKTEHPELEHWLEEEPEKDMPAISPKADGPKMETQEESHLTRCKKRALAYVERGQLKEAIDSFTSDFNKDKERSPEEIQLVGSMGMALRNQAELTEKDVKEFIEVFSHN